MRIKMSEQISFSSILFDSLFGLVLFFSMDSILEIANPTSLFFYLFSIIILVHWWLLFKSCDDAYNEEVTDSGLDLIIGIVQLVFIEFIVLTSRSSNYLLATKFLIVLLAIDLLWAIIWLYVGKWRTNNMSHINLMEKELRNNIKINLIAVIGFVAFILLFQFTAPLIFVIGFVLLYIGYIFLSFKYKIIDLDIF